MKRGERNLVLALLAILFLAGSCTLSGRHEKDKDVIKITARTFEYTPSRIELRKGEPVTLELISLDRLHGFNIPDLGVRADVLPDHSVQVELIPERAGTYTFLCDIFCGDEHGEMSGVIIVKD